MSKKLRLAVLLVLLPWVPTSARATADVSLAERPLRLEVVSQRTDGEQPTALAAADFDEDGTPDLVRGFASSGGAYLTLHRGDPGALFPTPGRASDAPPFVNPGTELAVSDTPDFLGVGDFDADGHYDIVVAERGGDRLGVLAGDGRGGFAPETTLDLIGAVTALVAGEIGRQDGLPDLVVGIDKYDGTGVLVFAGPDGALRAEPRFIGLPGRPVALAVDLLDGDEFHDIAVAADRSLFVVHGEFGAGFELARVDMSSTVVAMTVGDFADPSPRRRQLALLLADRTLHVLALESSTWRTLAVEALPASTEEPRLLTAARLAGASSQQLVVVEPAAARASVFKAGPDDLQRAAVLELEEAPVAVLPLRLNADASSDLVMLTLGPDPTHVVESTLLSTFTVTNTNDSGSGSLRTAIQQANSTAGADAIHFNIGGGGPFVISPSTPLPSITQAVTIDGYTQPGAQANTVASPNPTNAILLIQIDGTVAGLGSGLVLDSGSSTVRGLVIRGFATDDGITVNSSGNIIEGNYIGTNAAGSTVIGTPTGNANGVQVYGSSNIIGGTTPQSRNLISDNTDGGVDIQGASAFDNQVRGNFIGTDATGTDDLGNDEGVQIAATANNVIGGTQAGAGNLISGNEVNGLVIDSAATANLVQGNRVGTDAAGTAAVGNDDDGIELVNASNNLLGGTSPAARNVISGNDARGIVISGGGQNQVQGNYIGTDVSGTAALPNSMSGVELRGATASNTVGGASSGARNVMSGNLLVGVLITGGAQTNAVEGNYIGTNAAGSSGLGNAIEGVRILDAPNNVVGGGTAAQRNVISDNLRGVLVQGAPATGNRLQGNYIGTDAAGTPGLGNAQQGLLVFSASSTVIGGTGAADGNIFAGNGGAGVWVFGSTSQNNSMQRNSITGNGLLGIDIGANGVTLNDAGDGDSGSNGLQNHPVITSAVLDASTTTLAGTLNSTPSTTFRVEFFGNAACDPSGRGEGALFLGFQTVSTDAGGQATFSTVLPVGTLATPEITATATSTSGNTSEFSPCFTGSTCTGLVVFGETLLAASPASLVWSTPQDVHWVRGFLAGVSDYATVADGVLVGATALDISGDAPGPGQGLYYLVRPEECGSWQSSPGAEPGRDAALP